MANDGDEVVVWGDGNQTRSFLYIDECIEGRLRLTRSDWTGPFNIGSDEMITINKLLDYVMKISGKKLIVKHVAGPLGVACRNSDNRLIENKLGWRPTLPVTNGLEKTFDWIQSQIKDMSETQRKALIYDH